mgnify:CR=1 FL=1
MLVEVVFKDIETSVVIDVKRFGEKIEKALPFSSEARVWKQEVYFSTPIDIGYVEEVVYRASQGDVYYWPPEKALCIFHGFSQPYSPVVYVGNVVDPVQVLHRVEDGYKVEVQIHRVDDRYKHVVEVLQRMGYTTATPLRDGDRIVVAYKKSSGRRYSYALHIEDYGIYIESEALAEYIPGICTAKFFAEARQHLVGYARLDISEDNFIVLSATIARLAEIERALIDLERSMYNIALKAKI